MRSAHPIVRDVMTGDVVAVGPDTTFKHIAELLITHGISAVPVVDDQGRPIGVVSEADLLPKQEYAPGRRGPLRVRLDPVHRAKVEATRARELMTQAPIAVRPGTSVAAAARHLLHQHVKRLLVVDDQGRLVGVVSRRDLLRGFLRGDDAIRIEIHEGVIGRELCLDPLRFQVRVRDGNVTLSGQVDHEAEVPLLLERVATVEGIVSLDARVTAADHHGRRPRFVLEHR